MIRIGNQTAFSALPLEPFEYAVQNKFTAFEWFPDKKPTGEGWVKEDVDGHTRAAIKETARSVDIAVSLHAPWWANPVTDDGLDALLKHFRFARDVGATIINCHLYLEKGLETFVQSIRPVIEAAGNARIRLSIENTPLTTPEDFNHLFDRLSQFDDIQPGQVGMCLDLGHANLCDATRNDYIRFIDQLSPNVPIIHVHLHENYGEQDSHLTIFTGPSAHNDAGVREFVKRLKKRDYSGSIILEQWPQPPSLLNQARDRLVHIIGKNDRKRCSDGKPEKKGSSDRALKEEKKAEEVARYRKSLQAHDKPALEIPAVRKTEKKAPQVHGLDGFAKRLVTMEAETRSWREKLGWIASYVSTEVPDNSSLLSLAIYLRFLGTGEIVCTEDGRHFRPNHHAGFSQQIQEKLAQIQTSENSFILRKIYPWLPSFDSAYTRREPLTRIRDIAHRNDMPRELKNEIKHTLQNKLHRCAGPEDLITSADILRRITLPGANYSPDFVEQFKIFHEELKEFFNATSLEQRLQALPDHDGLSQWIDKFVALKRQNLTTPEHLTELLNCLTQLRRQLVQRIGQDAGAHVMRLAEIGLEDFAFVELSQLAQHLESQPMKWKSAFDALALTVENLILSGIEPEECSAIEAEIKGISAGFNEKSHSRLLQLKATLDRAHRLANSYSDRVLSMFPELVEKLGRALGVEAHVIQTYTEGDIRGNLIFQLSKLVSMLQKAVRHEAALPPWDILVPGSTAGRLVLAEHLYELADTAHEHCVVLLKKAEGDEEIPTGITGIIIAHGIPHLSHLGVRARQKGVVFVVCEEPELFHKLTVHVNEFVQFQATAEEVRTEFSHVPVNIDKKVTNSKCVDIPEVNLKPEKLLIPLEAVVLNTGGAKASEARRLSELSKAGEAGFLTPQGLVIPYGVMEACLEAVPDINRAYNRLVLEINGLSISEFDGITEGLRQLVLQIPVPSEVIDGVVKFFPQNARLMVRSSANCEDMEAMAGAGLYESIANVAPADVANAVRQVWASLWTKRAALSRKQADIPHEKAHMAVLIQNMITPDYSFIMHTVNPVNLKKDELYIELAVGMGETLASGAVAGIPYRMVCNKETASVRMLAFASFSHALWPDANDGLVSKLVDYTKVPLSTDEAVQQRVGWQLAHVGRFVEQVYSYPQDIEGVIVADTVYLVQSRPQQGV